MRALIAAIALASVFVCVVLVACNAVPSKTCYGDRVNAFSGDAAANDCTTCMQASTCCDLVGECGSDSTCQGEFESAQRCVVEGGPASEATCKASLQSTSSQALYACVRKPCGKECGIPSCDLDQAVVLIVDPACDRCMTGACCDSINACYGNRQCKLFLECITQHCPVTLGSSMVNAANQPHAALVETANVACGEAGTFDPALDPGPCLDRCLAEFAPTDAGANADDKAALCFAFGVYTCRAAAGCGPACLNDGGTGEDQPYPEDHVDSGVH